MKEYQKPKSLFFPLLLITAGVFIFLINIGTIEGTTWDNLLQYWPVILILGGLDGLYKRDGWVGPLVFLGLGTVLLLGNLHYLPLGAFALLLRLWPILLVAVGLDIAFGNHGSAWNTILRVMLGLLLVGIIVWIAFSSPFATGMKSVPFEQSLDGAVQSQVTFSVATGRLNVNGGADADQLVSGSAGLPKNMELSPTYTKPVNGASSLVLDGQGVAFLPLNASVLPWDFKLNSNLPLDLQFKVGVGEIEADLTDTAITDLRTEMGIGKLIVSLPCEKDSQVQFQLAIGDMEIYVPKGCDVTFNLDNGLTSFEAPDGYLKVNDKIHNQNADAGSPSVEVNIELAMGRLVIHESD